MFKLTENICIDLHSIVFINYIIINQFHSNMRKIVDYDWSIFYDP